MDTLRFIQEAAVTALLVGLAVGLPAFLWLVVSLDRMERRHLTEERLRRFARLNAWRRDMDASFAAIEARLATLDRQMDEFGRASVEAVTAHDDLLEAIVARLAAVEAWQRAETDDGR